VVKATSAKKHGQHLPNHHKLDMSAKISVRGHFKSFEILQGLKSNFFLTGAKIKMRHICRD
jgi:hypothetical protein